MNSSKTLLALAIAAVAPLAAQAESPDAIAFQDAPVTLSAAQVRAEYLALNRSAPRFGEAYPFQSTEAATARTRAEVRAEVLSMDRRAQRFGEAYPGDVASAKRAHGSAAAVHAGLN